MNAAKVFMQTIRKGLKIAQLTKIIRQLSYGFHELILWERHNDSFAKDVYVSKSVNSGINYVSSNHFFPSPEMNLLTL